MTKIEQKIPEGWSVKKLGELGDIVSGGTPDTENSTFWDGDIYWLTPSEVTKLPTKYVYQTERTITKEGLKNSSAKLLPKNSLIICTRATVGDCCINAVPMSTNQGFKNIILYEGSNIIYLYYLIANNKFQFIRKACGSTFLEISKKDVSNLNFLLPPLPEQEKIAGILSCWDDGIEKLSALIEKKKIQKKALMQQLLTGKHRLKGFSSPWHEVKLGNIGTTYTGLSGKDKESFGYGKPYIPYLNIYQNFVIDTNQFELVAIKDGENQNTVKYGDIFFTTSSETPDEVGISSVLLEEPKEETYLNSFCFGFRLHDFSILLPFYAAYLCRSEQIRKTMYMLAQGATRFNLSKTEFLKSYIYIPSDLAEQKAIAEILFKADEEIELLNKKLEAFKQEKKALMQQLLTGKIRVKVN